MSSAASVKNAISPIESIELLKLIKSLRDFTFTAIQSNFRYYVPRELIYSFSTSVKKGIFKLFKNFQFSLQCKRLIDEYIKELIRKRCSRLFISKGILYFKQIHINLLINYFLGSVNF
ncbi:unnamed protein product [Paramecium sonneborni]|uniref:Uncharacterized protein n=1 Tax=Paramecium sonneborni TaxID=65129 RepID=A0A8S1QJM7_9CILI|nr:unnamed protein product [Paramecium sonneborni]